MLVTNQDHLVDSSTHDCAASGDSVDLDMLPGLWRLQYTTAPDVLSLFQLERLPFSPLRVGDIFQRYSEAEKTGGIHA